MAKNNPYKIATWILIGVLVLGGITGFIAFGGNDNNQNTDGSISGYKRCIDQQARNLYGTLGATISNWKNICEQISDSYYKTQCWGIFQKLEGEKFREVRDITTKCG